MKNGSKKINKFKDPDIIKTENDLSGKIGMRVYLNNKKNNSGTLTFEYKALDQLDKLIEKFRNIAIKINNLFIRVNIQFFESKSF